MSVFFQIAFFPHTASKEGFLLVLRTRSLYPPLALDLPLALQEPGTRHTGSWLFPRFGLPYRRFHNFLKIFRSNLWILCATLRSARLLGTARWLPHRHCWDFALPWKGGFRTASVVRPGMCRLFPTNALKQAGPSPSTLAVTVGDKPSLWEAAGHKENP